MKVQLVPSSVGGNAQCQFFISYLINGTVAIDAGCLGLLSGIEDQARIRHVLLSHTHMDHIASLPVFLENVYETGDQPVTIHGSGDVLDCVRRDLLNNRIWPDLTRLAGTPFLRFETLESGKPIEVDGLRITPIEVNHIVPTLGFIVEEPRAAVVIPSDTGPTEALWKAANKTPNLKAVFLEASFPDSLGWLAGIARHLTPATFAAELKKLEQPVPIVAVHIKARYYAQVVAELNALALTHVEIGRPGREYVF